MQKEIHPDVKDTTITCACGEVYHTQSTREDVRIEVCGRCHPFYTGKKRSSARGGRVERFNKKYGFAEEEAEEAPETTAEEETAVEEEQEVEAEKEAEKSE